MARPQKQTVDYFPHDAHASEGDTLTVLQSRFGNDGYAFWFKLLEKLASSEGHFIDCSSPAKWQVLIAKMKVTELLGVEIVNLLVEMRAIDPELWENRLIWSQHLVNNLSGVYKNRRTEVPQKPVSTTDNRISTPDNGVTACSLQVETPQSRVKESKVNNIPIIPSSEIIFNNYERNIGQLTPVISDRLKLLLSEYSDAWIIEAIEKATLLEKRSLGYVEGILRGWKRDGKGTQKVKVESKRSSDGW